MRTQWSKITISPDKQTIEIKTSFKARNFYTLLINNQGITLPSYSSKWINAFNIQYEELYFYFQLLHDIKADNKTKDLQYRILTGIYNTNVLLTRKRIKNNLLCDFCLKETETVDHLFFQCTIVKDFWRKVEFYWNTHTNHNILLTLKEVILGSKGSPNILNYFLLLAKRHIHISKIKGSKPCIDLFITLLKNIYEIEKAVYSKNNMGRQFMERWPFIPQ